MGDGFLRLMLLATTMACLCSCKPAKPLSATQTAAVPLQPCTGSTSEVVACLVEQLVSPVPPKYENLSDPMSGATNSAAKQKEALMDIIQGQIHPRAAKARAALVEMGPAIYPELAKYRDDERYSCSWSVAAWHNFSVGYMVVGIMQEGVQFHAYGYKGRENPTNGNSKPDFRKMIMEKGGIEKYAEHAKPKTKDELQKEFIEWYIAKEKSFGFVNRQQEQDCLTPYLKKLDEIEQRLGSSRNEMTNQSSGP